MNSLFKKFFMTIWLVTIVFSFPAQALAGSRTEKFTRGFTNIVTAPLEFFRQPYALHRERDFNGMAAFFGGIFTGIYATVARELAGVYEFLTFPFPLPADYRSIIDPPTVFDGYKVPQDYKS